jgi:hypothetical protein
MGITGPRSSHTAVYSERTNGYIVLDNAASVSTILVPDLQMYNKSARFVI